MDDQNIVDEVNRIVKKFHQSIDPNFKNGIYENIINLSFHEKKGKQKKAKSSNYSAAWLLDTINTTTTSSSATNNATSSSTAAGSKFSSVPWESWSIKVNVHFAENEQQMNQFRVMAEKQLRACLLYISSLNISEILHIPPHYNDESMIHSFKVKKSVFIMFISLYYIHTDTVDIYRQ